MASPSLLTSSSARNIGLASTFSLVQSWCATNCFPLITPLVVLLLLLLLRLLLACVQHFILLFASFQLLFHLTHYCESGLCLIPFKGQFLGPRWAFFLNCFFFSCRLRKGILRLLHLGLDDFTLGAGGHGRGRGHGHGFRHGLDGGGISETLFLLLLILFVEGFPFLRPRWSILGLLGPCCSRLWTVFTWQRLPLLLLLLASRHFFQGGWWRTLNCLI